MPIYEAISSFHCFYKKHPFRSFFCTNLRQKRKEEKKALNAVGFLLVHEVIEASLLFFDTWKSFSSVNFGFCLLAIYGVQFPDLEWMSRKGHAIFFKANCIWRNVNTAYFYSLRSHQALLGWRKPRIDHAANICLALHWVAKYYLSHSHGSVLFNSNISELVTMLNNPFPKTRRDF